MTVIATPYSSNEAAATDPSSRSVHELFEEVAHADPQAMAVIDSDERLSYGELNRRANRVAAYLALTGVKRGDLVGISLERCAGMAVAMLAILKAGAGYVPLDTSYPQDRIQWMAADTTVRWIVTDKAHANSLPEGLALCLEDHWLSIDSQPGEDHSPMVSAEHAAYVMYTSGSTGVPKGVVVPHRAIVRLVRNTNYVSLGKTDVVAQIANASFDAITFEVWGALLNGGCLAILPSEVTLSPERFEVALEGRGVSTLFMTTALFNVIARMRPAMLRTLKTVLFGGEAVDPRAVRAVLRAGGPSRLLHVYGPTEATTFSTYHVVESLAENAVTVPIGKPISHSTAFILDAQFVSVAAGEPGELYVGGHGLALGYLNRPDLTAERFVNVNGVKLYRTGDMARYLPDGSIEFLGRTDHQVKLRGFRIELGEVESALRQNPTIGDCIAVVREDHLGVKQLAVYAVPVNHSKITTVQVRQFLAELLPAFMVPSFVVLMDSLPLTPAGKLDRAALPSPPEAEQAPSDPAGSDDLLERICAIWSQALGHKVAALDTSFFDLGGTSLHLAEVERELHQQLGSSLCIKDLFRYPTVRSLASRLRGNSTHSNLLESARQRAKMQKAAQASLRRPFPQIALRGQHGI